MKVTPVHAANPSPYTGDGNWTYLIDGARPILIDAGTGKDEHLDALAAAAPSGPADVLVTHAHSDHIEGVPKIQARWPDTRFLKMPWAERDRQIAFVPIADGDVIDTGEGPLETIHTPGHAPDHLSFWHAPSRTLFVGDLMLKSGTVFIPASHGGDLVAYLRSLERVARLAPARAWPAHGPVIEDPLALIQQYVKHRGQREAQVVSALESGLRTPETITAKIYANLSAPLTKMALESVRAHLRKLEDDGVARRDGDEWTLAR